MTTFNLGETTRLNSMAIRVKNRDLMINFYKMLGFDLKREENELAIFGTSEKSSELLWLEESPRAQAHEGELRKMARFSIIIPTKEEFADVFARVKQAKYTIQDALEDHGRVGFVTIDPEGNEIEIFCSDGKNGQRNQAKDLDEAAILAMAKNEFPKFSPEVRFDKVHLNVPDLQKQMDFYRDVLGLSSKNEQDGFFDLNKGHFHVGIQEGSSEVLTLPTDEVHGLDFIKFSVKEKDFTALADHLAERKQDFFIDCKKKILTIYDALGIEWWFFKEAE